MIDYQSVVRQLGMNENKMKRFLVLAWDECHLAGYETFKGHFDFPEEAEEFAAWLFCFHYENSEVIDTHDFKIIDQDKCYEEFMETKKNS